MAIKIECVVQGADILGEVPLWCERSQLLWWLDVRRPALQSYDPVTHRHSAIRLPDGLVTGSMALREEGGFLLATNSGLYLFDPVSGQPAQALMNPEPDQPDRRLNDGKCDRRGRFWVGSMDETRRGNPVGKLYRFDPDHSCHPQFDQVVVSNSIAFSPDDRTMYFADTPLQTTWAFDFDLDNGVISNRRVFKNWADQMGKPDGATVDVDGCLWTAVITSGELVRLTPGGEVDRVIKVPVTNPTCPAFGGMNRDVLFLTSHSQRLSPEQLATEPCAGGLFALDVGVQGLPEPRFRG